MDEPDIRREIAKSRRRALGCLWLFLAGPAALGVVVAVSNGGPGIIGWLFICLVVGGTVFMAVVFSRTFDLKTIGPRAQRRGRKRFDPTDRDS